MTLRWGGGGGGPALSATMTLIFPIVPDYTVLQDCL